MKNKNMSLVICTFLTLAIALLMSGTALAQDNCGPLSGFNNGGFENTSGCSASSSACFIRAFNDGCVSGWSAANGSPDACWSFPVNPVTPFEGEFMAAMGTSISSQCRHEAIFANVSLDPAKDYELSFHHRTSTISLVAGPVDAQVYLTSGLSNVISFSLDPCSNLNLSNSQLIYSQSSFQSNSWLPETVTFEPQAGLNQLLFVVYPPAGTVGTPFWLVDAVEIEECDPCADPIDANFDLIIPSSSGSNYTIEATNYDLYAGINGQHTWYVLTSPTANGPFTPAGVVSGNNFTFSAQDGIYYTVIHKVETDCGEFCYVQNICRNCPEGKGQACDLCGPVDCDIIDTWWPPCNDAVPTELGCQYFGSQLQVTWDPVPGATCYIVSFEPDAFTWPPSKNCCNGSFFFPISVNVSGTIANVPSSVPNCFRWRVRACCPEGFSEWSPYRCQASERACPIVGKPGRGGNAPLQADVEVNTIKVFPNPSSNRFNIALDFETTQEASLRIFDLSGQLVYDSGQQVIAAGESTQQWTPDRQLANGVYILEVNTSQQVIREKLMLNR
ncbi:MAG: T9SS type A sorting domain-containing protein [Bacteroidota bacterium]